MSTAEVETVATAPPDDVLLPEIRQNLESLQGDFAQLHLEAARLGEKISALQRERASVLAEADDIMAQIKKLEEFLDPATSDSDKLAEAARHLPVKSNKDWRQVPITELKLTTVVGMGRTKRERLIELVPTLGHFEDLRTQASIQHDELHSLMPKGIGQDTTNMIEERFLNWLQTNYGNFLAANDGVTGVESAPPEVPQEDPSAAAESVVERMLAEGEIAIYGEEPQVETTEIKLVPEFADGKHDFHVELELDSTSPAMEIKSESAQVPDQELGAFDDSPEQVRNRHSQLCGRFIAAGNQVPPGLVVNRGTYEDGRNAASRGWTIDDCNWTAGQQQDDWLIGYIEAVHNGHLPL